MKDFDFEAFKKRCVYDEELQKTIMEGSIPNIPEQLNKIEEAFRGNDAYSLEREAHGLKGTSGTLSALKLQETVKEIELSAKSGEVKEEVEELLRSARENYNTFLSQVEGAGIYSRDSSE
ncbi:MAG: Hpt domain-containing protein [Spirochaetaceae bacterium]